MLQSPSQIVAELLVKWRTGDQEALQALVPLVYRDLRAVAHAQLSRERPGHTLQTTDLVHQVYLRLVERRPFEAENRAHFVAAGGRAYAPNCGRLCAKPRAAKRGAEHKAELDPAVEMPQMPSTDVVAVDDALNLLAQVDQQQCNLEELRFFGALSTGEAAEMLGISRSTAKREWNVAKAWLARQMKRGSRGETKAVGKD